MYSDWVGPALAGFLALWLGGLTFFSWRQNRFLRELFPKSGERDIRRKFEELLKQVLNSKQDLDNIKESLSLIKKAGEKYIQRVELNRYNPYDDTGGDQSFSLALLDNRGNGVVLTSLHARSGTRIFAKSVSLGEGVKYHLSEEEKKVVKKVIKI